MQKIPHDPHVAHVNLLSPCRFQDSLERQTAAAKLKRFFFATVNDLALLTIRSTVLKQNDLSLIQSMVTLLPTQTNENVETMVLTIF